MYVVGTLVQAQAQAQEQEQEQEQQHILRIQTGTDPDRRYVYLSVDWVSRRGK